jgi:hypothetical protein
VLLTIENHGDRLGIVLRADDAERLGRAIAQQARYSRKARRLGGEVR